MESGYHNTSFGHKKRNDPCLFVYLYAIIKQLFVTVHISYV